MAAIPPSKSKPSGSADENPEPILLEERLHQFWQKNRTVVLGLCVVVLAAILGKGIWERYQRSQEQEIESAFGAATTPDQLHAFATAHPDHPLAGVAELKLADDAYTAGKAEDALAGYEKALSILKGGPLAARAQLGHALAEVQAGKTADATSDLKQIFNDTTQFKAARVEAGYQLASLAADSANTADVQKYVDQLMQIDPTSPWTQRGMMLRATLPAPATLSAGLPAAPGSSPVPAKKDGASPGLQIKIPGK